MDKVELPADSEMWLVANRRSRRRQISKGAKKLTSVPTQLIIIALSMLAIMYALSQTQVTY